MRSETADIVSLVDNSIILNIFDHKKKPRLNSASAFMFLFIKLSYSTVTDFAKLRGLSTSQSRCNAA